jgi:uncharacterized protein DUF4382
MAGSAYHRLSWVSSTLFPLIACLLCVTGCNNTCVSGSLNGASGSNVSVMTGSSPPPCTLSTANGIVHLEIGATSGGTSPPGIAGPQMTRPVVTHLFVTLAGVDVHSSPLAGDDTPGWLPLAAQLQANPLQVDLLAELHANASSAPFPDAVLPAGVYRQVRLRPATPSLEESATGANPCGAGTPHCAVMSDGRVWPLAFPRSRPDLRMMLESVPGRQLYVPPDGAVALVIELDRDRSWAWPSGDSLLFAPVFRLSVGQPPNVSEN